MGVVLWNKSVQEVRPNAVSNNWAVNPRWMGQSVIINPALDWGDREECASDQFHILGMPQNGTLAEYVSVDASR